MKGIKKMYNAWRFRRGYEIAAGVLLYNDRENGLDVISKILNETETYKEYHRGMYDARRSFLNKCR